MLSLGFIDSTLKVAFVTKSNLKTQVAFGLKFEARFFLTVLLFVFFYFCLSRSRPASRSVSDGGGGDDGDPSRPVTAAYEGKLKWNSAALQHEQKMAPQIVVGLSPHSLMKLKMITQAPPA